MDHFVVGERGEELRGSAGRRHAQQTGPRRTVRREHDRVLRGPRPAPQLRRVGQRLGRASRHRHLLKFAAREKPDPLSIGGKERSVRVVGSRQGHRVQLIEPSHVQLGTSLRTLLCDEREDGAIGRNERRRRQTASRDDQVGHRRPVRPRDGDRRPARGATAPRKPTASTSAHRERAGRDPRRPRTARWRRCGPRSHGVVERVDLEPDVANVPDALLRLLDEASVQQRLHRWRRRRPGGPTSRVRARESVRSCPTPCRPRRRHARSTSRRARSRTPRCRRACRLLSRAPVPGSCTPPYREWRHGRRRSSSASPTSAAVASPKSSTFTMPSGVILMFAGLRSRWTMPFLVRGLERFGDLASHRDRVVQREPGSKRRLGKRGLRRDGEGRWVPKPFRQCVALDEFEDQESDAVCLLEAVDRADVGMVQRREDPRLPLEAREAIRAARDRARQDLDGDITRKRLVARAIHLSHPADAKERLQVIFAERLTGQRRGDRFGDHARREMERRLGEKFIGHRLVQ